MSKREAPGYRIQNVVATASIGQRLDLTGLSQALLGADYRPETFPGVIYRIKKPKATALIFSTEKMVCSGATSETSAGKAIIKIIDDLRRNSIVLLGKPEIKVQKVQNIVASGSLGGPIELEKTARSLGGTVYEPEQFPALIHWMEKPKATFLIFASGKIVCPGTKREEDIKLAIAHLQDTLEENAIICSLRSRLTRKIAQSFLPSRFSTSRCMSKLHLLRSLLEVGFSGEDCHNHSTGEKRRIEH